MVTDNQIGHAARLVLRRPPCGRHARRAGDGHLRGRSACADGIVAS